MTIEVIQGDIFKQDVDAIVNPANSYMLHGGGLAGLIARRAGPDLIKESQDQAPVQTGHAIATTAGELPFKGVIHTVGPVWEGPTDAPYWRKNRNDQTADPDELLALAHSSAIAVAGICGYTSVAFPAVSCGVFRFPVERAAPIAIKAAREALRMQQVWPKVDRVVFCLVDPYHYEAFKAANNLANQPSFHRRLRAYFGF